MRASSGPGSEVRLTSKLFDWRLGISITSSVPFTETPSDAITEVLSSLLLQDKAMNNVSVDRIEQTILFISIVLF